MGSWLSGSWWADRLERHLPGPLGRIVESARKDDILLLSGSLAFYALVSIVPLAILSLWATSLAVGDRRIADFSEQLTDLAPRDIGIDRAIQSVGEQGTRLGVVAVIIALWPASAYGSGLARAFERLSPRRDRERTPLRGRGILLLVLLPMFILGSIVVSLIGSAVLGDALAGQILGLALALAGGFVMSAVAVAAIYVAFPPERLPWRSILEAAAFTAAGVSVLSLAFVLYLSLGANFQERYASSGMAAVALLAVWLYASNVLVLVGYKGAIAAGDGRGRASRSRSRSRRTPTRR